MSKSPPIIYTWTDEAPALATHALLPVIRAFAGATGVPVETRDISLAGRMLAVFADVLGEGQGVPDDLAELGRLVETPEANVIKLPNVSASIPQLKACIAELQAKGYALPDYPDEPADEMIRVLFGPAGAPSRNPLLTPRNAWSPSMRRSMEIQPLAMLKRRLRTCSPTLGSPLGPAQPAMS